MARKDFWIHVGMVVLTTAFSQYVVLPNLTMVWLVSSLWALEIFFLAIYKSEMVLNEYYLHRALADVSLATNCPNALNN